MYRPVRPLSLLLLLLTLPATAWAQGPAEEVAAKAQQAHDEHCADVASAGAESDAARATVEVGEVWAEVAEVYDATGATWLLYWRGLLAQCIGQEERAADALVEFIESDPTTEGLTAMANDARKRLKRLRPDYEPPKPQRLPPTPEQRRHGGQVGAGVVLGLGAAGAGVGSGLGFVQLSATHTTLTTARHSTAEVEGLLDQGDAQLAAGIGLAVGAGVAVVASIGVLARAARRPKVEVAVLAAPMDGGVALGVGGRW